MTPPRTPNLFIVGAPRCGTTSMAFYLHQHPDIFMASGEPHFFGSDIAYNKPPMTEMQYVKLFAGASRERYVGEKSTWYLYSQRAASEIKRFCPHAKVIIQLRNPVDMLISWHRFLVHSKRYEPVRGFADALAAEAERRSGGGIPARARFPDQLYYSRIPRYTEQVRRYVDALGNEQVHILLFDDLIADPLEAYRQTLRFLNVDDTFAPRLTPRNVGRTWRNLTIAHAISRCAASPLLRGLLPRSIGRGLHTVLIRMNSAQHRPADSALRQALQAEFADEVRSLQELLGRDLSTWMQDTSGIA